MALPQILVLQLKKPLILLPQTLGPFKGLMARAIGRYIMRRASMVYSRDQTSFEEAGRLLGNQRNKLRFSHDMAFVLEPVRPDEAKLADLPQRDVCTPLIGINVSGLLLMGGYNHDNMFGLKADYARLLHEVIDRFVREYKANVILVPHVFGNDAESDTLACSQIFQQLQPKYGKRLHLLRGDFNQHEIKYVIGQCDFFLGSRMHACIAALSQSIPAVCLAYSRKFIGVMESIDCAELVTDLRFLDNDASLKSIFHIFASRSRIRDLLLAQTPTARARVMAIFSRENLA
jgi:polysaccharide pyruvyl transferase WcaK-like protein